jgi:hypothetical protein
MKEFEVRFKLAGCFNEQFRVLRAPDEQTLRHLIYNLGGRNIFVEVLR